MAPASLDYPPIITVPASPNMDHDMTDGTPYLLASPIKQATGDMEQLTCPRSSDGPEQPEDQYRPMTLREEEIMKIHEDGIYCSPDRIEKTGGFWITSSNMNQGESCSFQTARQQPVTTASGSHFDIEELLRDTPEPGTPPVQSPVPGPSSTPGAAKITREAAHGTTGDLEAVVDELQARTYPPLRPPTQDS